MVERKLPMMARQDKKFMTIGMTIGDFMQKSLEAVTATLQGKQVEGVEMESRGKKYNLDDVLMEYYEVQTRHEDTQDN